MQTLTTSAHLEPDTTARVSRFAPTRDDEGFVSLRIGGDHLDLAFIARPGTADTLRVIARAAEEAATILDHITDTATDGAA
ncbi:hypothetical protein ACN6LA_005211 [Streptomyces sp. SAS_269]|uniref:hypothetical protein n=1 Tax=Streptomyces sp. SAS_269 TaxID=3412749 RepID=UPI00403C26A3